jgi:FKBP-type peptidyl-prolyl cis-trans isomerase SlpA
MRDSSLDPIREGSRVTLHYTLALGYDRSIVDSTDGREPVTIVVGRSGWLPVLERRLLGLRAGARCLFEITADETADPASESLRYTLDRSDFPPAVPPDVDSVIGFELPDGTEIAGTIVIANEKTVTVDFTSPLSGHDLVFQVDILAVEPPN